MRAALVNLPRFNT